MGAHITPPMSKPRMIIQLNCSGPIRIMKVIDSVRVTKNSAKLWIIIVCCLSLAKHAFYVCLCPRIAGLIEDGFGWSMFD